MGSMKSRTEARTVLLLVFLLTAFWPSPGRAQVVSIDELQVGLRLVEIMPGPDGTGERFVYADVGSRLHVFSMTPKGMKREWDSPPFSGRIVNFY